MNFKHTYQLNFKWWKNFREFAERKNKLEFKKTLDNLFWEVYSPEFKNLLLTYEIKTGHVYSNLTLDDIKLLKIRQPELNPNASNIQENIIKVKKLILSEIKNILNENELFDIIKTQGKSEKFYTLVDTDDFILKYDDTSYMTLDWIYMKTNKYRGTDIFKAFLQLAKERGHNKVKAWAIKGADVVKINGKSKSIVVNGYYTMLRWGFIPEGGIKFINKVLHSNYESLESAIIDPEFWNRWKLEGKEFIGFFDLSSNSLSWKILNK